MMCRLRQVFVALSLLLTFVGAPSLADARAMPVEMKARIDRQAQAVLARTGAPSASIAVILDGKIAYLRAYGSARLEPEAPATPATRYAIGSVSKQFTATALLMLAEEGRLRLDDAVGKYVPNLTDGDRITVRQVLNMTAGYRDYWPQDYVPAAMSQPTTADQILDGWARVPLDFQPGSDWQYSNTGYIIAGLVAEKAAGEPLWRYLDRRIFTPLKLTSVYDYDAGPLPAGDAGGYTRFALGPVRPAIKEGRGWVYAMGWLGMTAEDLARWDLAMMEGKLLKPASYAEQQTNTTLSDGRPSGYGLGIFVGGSDGRPMLSHDGAMSGYLAVNRIYPQDRAAIVVLTNADFGSPQTAIADRIADIIFPDADEASFAREVFEELKAGRIDRSRFTPNGSAYFTEQALGDFAGSLSPLGEPDSFVRTGKRMRGGMTVESYSIGYAGGRKLQLILRALPDGRIEQFMISEVT